MKNIKSLYFMALLSFVISCKSEGKQDTMDGDKSKTAILNVKVVNEIDPVCEMSTENHVKDTLTYQGKLYGFCNTSCKEEFRANPENYLKKK